MRVICICTVLCALACTPANLIEVNSTDQGSSDDGSDGQGVWTDPFVCKPIAGNATGRGKFEPATGKAFYGIGQVLNDAFFWGEQKPAIDAIAAQVDRRPHMLSAYVGSIPSTSPSALEVQLDRLRRINTLEAAQYRLLVGMHVHRVEDYALLDSGAADDNLRDWGAYLATVEIPIFARIIYEINSGDGRPSLQTYATGIDEDAATVGKRAFRRIVDKMREGAGGDPYNVAWVWHIMPEPPDHGTGPFADFYPGDDYVDWIGISFWGLYMVPQTETAHAFAVAHNKPILAGETGPTQWDGVLWSDVVNTFFAPLLSNLGALSNWKGFVYINTDWTQIDWLDWPDFRLQSNPVALNYVAQTVADARYALPDSSYNSMLQLSSSGARLELRQELADFSAGDTLQLAVDAWTKECAGELFIAVDTEADGQLHHNQAPSSTISGNLNWQRLDTTYAIPAGTARIVAKVVVTGPCQAGIDNFYVWNSTTGHNIVQYGSFEQLPVGQTDMLVCADSQAYSLAELRPRIELVHGRMYRIETRGAAVAVGQNYTAGWLSGDTLDISARGFTTKATGRLRVAVNYVQYGEKHDVVSPSTGLTGTVGWSTTQTQFVVPPDTTRVDVFVLLTGVGTAGFDDLSVINTRTGEQLVINGDLEASSARPPAPFWLWSSSEEYSFADAVRWEP